MNNLDLYVEEIKRKIEYKKLTEELEIIKYVYIDLGNRFSFDEKFIPFGNSKSRQNLYKYHCHSLDDLNNCMDTNTIICKSLAKILEYVLRKLDINITTIVDPVESIYQGNSYRKCPHVLNRIKLMDGRSFYLDLQEDIKNIQTHSFTNSFGIISEDKNILTHKEQEELDIKIGYIGEDYYYSDEYLYLLHTIADSIDSFKDKAKFVLENIDYIPTTDMGYTDRQWHHRRVLENFFDEKEFDYDYNTGKIKIYDCYKDIDNERKYYTFITVNDGKDTDIYVYNEIDSKYSQIGPDNWLHCVENGLMVHGTITQKVYRKINK